MSELGQKPQREQNESGARIADTERTAEMTDVSNQNTKRRERLILVGQVAAMLAGVVAILVAVVSFLSFVTNECEAGTPFLPEAFPCFPPK